MSDLPVHHFLADSVIVAHSIQFHFICRPLLIMNTVIKQLYRNPVIGLDVSLMNGEDNLEKGTCRGTRVNRETLLIWKAPDLILSHYVFIAVHRIQSQVESFF